MIKNKKRDISKYIFRSYLFIFLILISLFILIAFFSFSVLATDTSSSINLGSTNHVNVNCRSDSSCGKTGLLDNKFCIDNDVYSFYQTAVCINPKTTESYCQIQKISKIVSDCGESTCSDSGKKYCVGNDLYQDKNCNQKGCKSGSCFSEKYNKKTLIESCSKGCEKGECKVTCYKNEDCGKSGFMGKEYCSNDDVFKNHQTAVCKYPGTLKSSCQLETIPKKILDCGTSECSSIGNTYCIGNKVYQDKICTLNGCDSGACFSRTSSKQTALIKECSSDEKCSNGKCSCDPYEEISYSEWKNISFSNNMMNQSRIKTIHEFKDCKPFRNFTTVEYRTIASCCNTCNTNPVPNWQCSAWSSCLNGYQNRTCTDLNNCNNPSGKPAESQSCSHQCVPFWDCSKWETCSDGTRKRTCNDLYNCGIDSGKPDEGEDCSSRHYYNDYGTVTYTNKGINTLTRYEPEKEPMVSISNYDETQQISYLGTKKINSATRASSVGLKSSNTFISLFILALILVILLVIIAFLFRT